jgi:hypothetical protein
LDWLQKSSKYRKQLLEPFVNQHPTREEILKLTSDYKKKHRKQLKKHLEAEQNKFDNRFNQRLKDIQFESADKQHVSTVGILYIM